MKKAGFLGAIAAAFTLIGAVAPAHAATTIGLSPPPPEPPGSPAGNCATPFPADGIQVSTAPGITYEVPPGGGVITSWSTTTVGTGQLRLRLFAPTSSASVVTPVAESAWLDLGPQPQTSIPTRIPVSGGEKLGFSVNSTSSTGCTYISDNPANTGAVSATGPLGQPTATIAPPGQPAPVLFSISAVVEPDADGDGLGDETQDRCPGEIDPPNGICSSLGLGKPKASSKKGTATIVATVQSAGVLSLKGRNVAAQTVQVDGAGQAKLTVKPRGRVKRKLTIGGKASVRVTVTFTSSSGRSLEETAKVKLKKAKAKQN